MWAVVDAAVTEVVARWPLRRPFAPNGERHRSDRVRSRGGLARRWSRGRSSDAAGSPSIRPRAPCARVAAWRGSSSGRKRQTSTPRSLVQVARGFERVQRALDEHAAHRFAPRLTGADAQQLIVEMAHDMRSPLGSILILAERLRAGAGGELTADSSAPARTDLQRGVRAQLPRRAT